MTPSRQSDTVKLRVQLLLDLRRVGKPITVELDGSKPESVWQAFGELADELKERAIAMAGENIFPLQATAVGVEIKRLR